MGLLENGARGRGVALVDGDELAVLRGDDGVDGGDEPAEFVVGGDEGRADPDGVTAQFEDVDVAQGQGAGGGVSGVGGAVLEDRRLLAVAVERLPDARQTRVPPSGA
ncbi:hypothetical protein [Streptomyces collinus]|uniref:hypothetical protein n=1 Tax=Streptomyces collinus TaxID=42684 RepID=UPI00381ED8FD